MEGRLESVLVPGEAPGEASVDFPLKAVFNLKGKEKTHFKFWE